MPNSRPGSLPYPVKGEASFESFLKEYMAKRQRNMDHPTEEGMQLTTAGFTSFNFLKSPVYAIPKPEGPNVHFNQSTPLFAQRARDPGFRSPRPSGTVITLMERLRPQFGYKSQVWIAQVDTIKQPVIAKIFQDCMLPDIPIWLHSQLMDFVPEDEQSHREAWAYHTLAHLQGSLIPRSYGFYDVSLFL
jgi:hypothetical protein